MAKASRKHRIHRGVEDAASPVERDAILLSARSVNSKADMLDPERYDELFDDAVFIRTCGRCGRQTEPRWSESSSLEEARRDGWRRVAASDRPGSHRLDLCGNCAVEAGYRAPIARRSYY